MWGITEYFGGSKRATRGCVISLGRWGRPHHVPVHPTDAWLACRCDDHPRSLFPWRLVVARRPQSVVPTASPVSDVIIAVEDSPRTGCRSYDSIIAILYSCRSGDTPRSPPYRGNRCLSHNFTRHSVSLSLLLPDVIKLLESHTIFHPVYRLDIVYDTRN